MGIKERAQTTSISIDRGKGPCSRARGNKTEKRKSCHDGSSQRYWPPESPSRLREVSAQVEAVGAVPKLVLHGRQVPGLLQHHHGLLALPVRRRLRNLRGRLVPANRGWGQAHGGLLFQKEAGVRKRSSDARVPFFLSAINL